MKISFVLSLVTLAPCAHSVESSRHLRSKNAKEPDIDSLSLFAASGAQAKSAGGWGNIVPIDQGRNAGNGQWNDEACFMDVSRFGLNATANNIVFRAGHATKGGMPEVLVFQENMDVSDDVHRTLVFKSSDGKCNPQAGTLCKHVDGSRMSITSSKNLAASSVFAGASALEQDGDALGVGSSDDLCNTMVCNADIRKNVMDVGASYVRSMASTMLLLAQRTGEGTVCAASSPKNVVNIGFGSGSFGMLLHEYFPSMHQTVVELSTEVVQAAHCFGVQGTEFDLQNADGRAYLEGAADGSLDAIFVDAFDSNDNVPACLATAEFLGTIRKKLRDGGVFAMNAHSGTTLRSDLNDLLPVAKATFKNVMLGKAPGLGNVIITAIAGDKQAACKPGAVVSDGSSSVDDLKSWWNDATFEAVSDEQAVGQPRTDASVGCQR